jgi:ATP-dependent helicase/nuclease subunit A
VRQAVCIAIASEAGQWILKKRESEGNELALTGSSEGRVQANVIDRTFIEKGVRWIIDYKTARFEGEATEADWKDRAGFYRPQLERYASLFVAEGHPVRLGIFFVAHGRLISFQDNQT